MGNKEWDDMEPKMMILSKWFWVAVVFAAFTSRAMAQDATQPMIAHLEHNNVTIYDEPCSLGGWFAKWKRAEWVWNGEKVPACWTLSRSNMGKYVVFTVDPTGTPGYLPAEMFETLDQVQKQKQQKPPKGTIGV